MNRWLVVMLKDPVAGRVKTRLGREIGNVAAAWWFRHQTRSLLRRLRDPRWQLILAVSPDRTALHNRFWPADLARLPQGLGDLGQRMAHLMHVCPPGPVCIVGGDIPGISRQHIARAFAALGPHQAVFGPAHDGGYWLVGLKRVAALPAGLFVNVRWSGPHALRDSIAGLTGMKVALTDTLRDVDTAEDLSRIRHDAAENP